MFKSLQMPSTFTLEKVEAGKVYSITVFNGVLTKIQAAIRASQDASGGLGTVSSVTANSTSLSQLFTITVATNTTTPDIIFAAVTKAANLVFASPTTGSAAVPTFRSLVLADLPTVTYLKGGSGLITLGTAFQILRVNTSTTANEWVSFRNGSTKLSISQDVDYITFDVVPANIEINDLNTTTKLTIANGGTGYGTQQAAINALTAASAGTVGYILRLDASKNAIWTIETVGISNLNGLTGANITIGTDDIAEGATNLYYTEARVAANTAVALNTAKVTNANHSGDVTGSTALTIAANAVTYAKFQAISATKKLIGRISGGAGNAEEIAISGNLAMSSSDLIVRTSKIKTITSNYSIPITEGTILVNGSSLTTTLPDTTTVANGDEFIIKNIASAATNTLSVFNIGTESIDGSTTYSMNLPYDVVTLKYGGSNKWYIISKIVNV